MANTIPYTLSKHAERRIHQRRINLDLIRRTFEFPDWVEPDPLYPFATKSFKRFYKQGNTVLCVGYNHAVQP